MRVMTEKVQALFEKANQGGLDKTPCICGYYGRACRKMGTKPDSMLCTHCPLAKFLDEAKRIIPQEGAVYENRNGWRYLCVASPAEAEKGISDAATMQRVSDGWTVNAHNVYLYPDGSIEWDFSTDGHWEV